MLSLFRRKSTDLVDEAITEVTADEPAASAGRSRGYTPSKRELGKETPKRVAAGRRPGQPAPTNRREAYRQMRQRQRTERAEAMEGMRNGEERYLLPRDRGPERALTRDIIDSQRTVGTWFFGGALVVLIGSSAAMPPVIQIASNLLWATLALLVVGDSILISRKVRKLVRQRFPKTEQRLGSLYLYAIMRSITFRRMRMPKPRVNIGDAI